MNKYLLFIVLVLCMVAILPSCAVPYEESLPPESPAGKVHVAESVEAEQAQLSETDPDLVKKIKLLKATYKTIEEFSTDLDVCTEELDRFAVCVFFETDLTSNTSYIQIQEARKDAKSADEVRSLNLKSADYISDYQSNVIEQNAKLLRSVGYEDFVAIPNYASANVFLNAEELTLEPILTLANSDAVRMICIFEDTRPISE